MTLVSPRAFILPLLLATAPAVAQHKGLFVTSPLDFGVTRETKFIVDNRELSDDVLLLAPPTLALLRLSPRGELSLSYQPELQAFKTHRELTSVNHHAELVFSHALTPSLTVGLGDTFVSTSDPSRRVVDSVLLLPRDRLMENAFHAEISQRFGHATTFTARYDHTTTLIQVPEESRTGLIDRVTASGSGSLSQRLGRRHLVIATYQFLDSRPLRPSEARDLPGFTVLPLAPDQAHIGALSLLYDGDTFHVRMAGGLLYGQRDLTYTGGGEIEKRLGRGAIAFIVQRNLSFFGGVVPSAHSRLGSGIVPFGLYEAAIVRLRAELSDKLSVQLQGVGQRTFTELTELDIRSDFGRLKVEYRLGRKAALFGVAELYRQSFNEFVGSRLAWQRYGLGVSVSATHKPNPLEERRRLRAERERRMRRGEAVEGEDDGSGARGVSGESR